MLQLNTLIELKANWLDCFVLNVIKASARMNINIEVVTNIISLKDYGR